MKKLIVLAMMAMMTMSVQAATYSDRLIEFEYDDTYQAIIELTGFDYVAIRAYPMVYNQDFSTTPSTGISLFKNYDGNVDTWIENFKKDAEVISEDPLEVLTGDNVLKKVLCVKDDYTAIVAIANTDETSEHYEFCRQIYDSAKVTDYFKDNDLPEEMFHPDKGYIYFNMPFSSDIIPYLEQCVKVLDDALDGGDIKKCETSAENLRKAVDDIAVKSGYLSDKIIGLYMMPTESDFRFSDTHPEYLIDAKLILLRVIETLNK